MKSPWSVKATMKDHQMEEERFCLGHSKKT